MRGAREAAELTRTHEVRSSCSASTSKTTPVSELTKWYNEQRLTGARLTGVGGFSSATVAWFDSDSEYREIMVADQVELLARIGDVTEKDGEAVVHAHVVRGTRDGTARGEHLIAVSVRPTLELIVDEAPAHLRRR